MKIFNRHIADQLSAYIQNELTDKQVSNIENHLATCQKCKKEYEEIEQGIFLAKQLSLSKCPDSLWNGVEHQLRLQEKATNDRKVYQLLPKLTWSRAFATAAIVIIFYALGVSFIAINKKNSTITNNPEIAKVEKVSIKDPEKGTLPSPSPTPVPNPKINDPNNVLRQFERGPSVSLHSDVGDPSELSEQSPKLVGRGFGSKLNTDPSLQAKSKSRIDARPQRLQTLPMPKIASSKGKSPSLILLNPGVFQPGNVLRTFERGNVVAGLPSDVGSYNFNQNSTQEKIEISAHSLEATIDNRRIANLPINSRNFLDFSLISPNSNKSSTATSAIPFNGQTSRSNNFTIDGLDNNDTSSGHSTFNQVTVDGALVANEGYQAEFGRSTGSVIQEKATTNGSETTTSEDPMAFNEEAFKNYGVNVWTKTKKDNFSTFAVDVDTGSYTIARRMLNEGSLPATASVRVEEFVNYFKYQYPSPVTNHPFSLTMEASVSPFNANRHLLRIGLKGREVTKAERPATHLTFLVDNSGSMSSEDKLGLVKKSLKILVKNLDPQDTVAITTYAGGVSLVLPPTSIVDKAIILDAIDNLVSGGGTAMEAGIDLAYKQANASFQEGSINRIIICSDGDANIGKTNHTEILKQIKSYVDQGITVSTIGFGMGNYKDTMMEQFANKGNGNYYYVDNISEAKRIFVKQLTGTLQVIAKDVKVQVEFNPTTVSEYRLVGYENRDIADEDFRNDKIDAGEIGAGHTVTAIYEVKLRKQPESNLATVRLRYKTPDAQETTPAQEVEASFDLARLEQNFDTTSEDFRFSIAVAAFAEVLRGSFAAKDWSLEKIASIAATSSQPNDKERQEFLQLVKKAQELKLATSTATPENN
jgi:Ca-activated chloride channel homolog